ncbi:hypothetical protein pb186bvf_004467 [Paramecium bursaria]
MEIIDLQNQIIIYDKKNVYNNKYLGIQKIINLSFIKSAHKSFSLLNPTTQSQIKSSYN